MDGYSDAQKHEAVELANALVANETSRDAFLAVAHTALFASSLAFLGNAVPIDDIRCVALLILGWLASVVGLIAMTISFPTSSKHIEDRRNAILKAELPRSNQLDVLNLIALWTFPTALLLLFLFASINVVSPMRGRFIPRSVTGIRGGVMPGSRLPEVLETRGVSPPRRLPDTEKPPATPTPSNGGQGAGENSGKPTRE